MADVVCITFIHTFILVHTLTVVNIKLKCCTYSEYMISDEAFMYK